MGNMTYETLHNCGRLQIRPSPIEGYGVFATDPIKKGEVLEEVPFILFGRWNALGKSLYDMISQMGFLSDKEKFADTMKDVLGHKAPERYYFKWFAPAPINGEQIAYVVLPLGYGPIYNTKNCDNNAGWTVKPNTFLFKAEKDIEKDEEICTFFGYFLGEGGQIFNCTDVFNLAIDNYNGQHKMKAIRFGDASLYEQAKSNPAYAKIAQILAVAKDGIVIHRLSGSTPDGVERAAMDILPSTPISFLYQKLFEFKHSPLPIIKINIKFNHKDSGVEILDEIIFKK